MLFNTLEFWLFFALVFLLYLRLPRLGQNILLLVASYLFYACWDWRFVGLLWLSTVVDWLLSHAVARSSSPKIAKRWVTTSVVVNLGFLGFFKYFNFFQDSLAALLVGWGWEPGRFHLEIVLPVGISFYTFQSISYIIDVYRKEVEPARNPLDFALFVAFFPHMVAGPIMHSSALLPQMQMPRLITWDKVRSGFHLAMWGLFKKIYAADNLARIAEPFFDSHKRIDTGEAHLAALAFAFQIYCDFSGYTDIARGIARMMGFELMLNFNHPYSATSMTQFWRKWHISLSTWLRDYLFIPLGGSRNGLTRTCRNLMLTMTLGGLWHGAAWNFVWWGMYHGVLLVTERVMRVTERQKEWFAWPAWRGWLARAACVVVVLHLILLGWILFRCNRTEMLGSMLVGFLNPVGWFNMPLEGFLNTIAYLSPVVLVESCGLFKKTESPILLLRWPYRTLAYTVLTLLFLLAGAFQSNEFIYFQF